MEAWRLGGFCSIRGCRQTLGELSCRKVGVFALLSQLGWDKQVLTQLKRISVEHGVALYRSTGFCDVQRMQSNVRRHMEWSDAYGNHSL